MAKRIYNAIVFRSEFLSFSSSSSQLEALPRILLSKDHFVSVCRFAFVSFNFYIDYILYIA